MQRIAVIGAGNVGTALASVLQRKGYSITGICSRTEASAHRGAKLLGCRGFTEPGVPAREADIVLITTPDRAIESVGRRLVEEDAVGPGQVVVHTSGAHSSKILDAVRSKGATALSMHPLQTFPDVEAGVRALEGSYFTLEGDEQSLATGLRMVEALGGRPLTIPTAMKPLYHAAACVACNYFVGIMDVASKMMEQAGLPREQTMAALLPLVEGTLQNIRRVGLPAALTGPIERGDTDTIAAHLRVMEMTVPELLEVYRVVGRHTADTAWSKGTLGEEERQRLLSLLSDDS